MQLMHTLASRGAAITLLTLAVAACGSDASTGLGADDGSARLTAQVGNSSRTTTTAANCNGNLAAITVDQVTVPSGATCTLSGTRVLGDVKVRSDASLLTSAARIDGSIQADDALTVATRNSTLVDGDIQVKRRATAKARTGGGVRLNSNRVAQKLQRKENLPAPTGSGSIAGDKEDQCRPM